MIHKCNCNQGKNGVMDAALYQDRMYGRGNRVHTIGTNKITCSVCGNVVKITVSKEKSKEDKK